MGAAAALVTLLSDILILLGTWPPALFPERSRSLGAAVAAAKITVSSAYICNPFIVQHSEMLSPSQLNNKGPSSDPCAMLILLSQHSDFI